MYTFEDDHETSARLRKRDFQHATSTLAPDAQAENGTPDVPAMDTTPGAQTAQAATLDALTADATMPRMQTAGAGVPEPTVSARPSRRERIARAFSGFATPGTSLASQREKRLAIAALFVVCASVFVTSMDQTVVVTALPKIIADPGISIPITQLDHAAWIVSAYLLGFVIAMPLMGRVSDIFGRRRILLLCLAIFGFGSILCALSPVLGQSVDISFLSNFGLDTSSQGLIWLISARFIQAIGGGAVVPVAIAVVSDFYGKARLSLALGIIGAVTEAGGVVGPLYGALLVQTLGWTSIFYLNIPIVLVLMVGVILFTPGGHQRRRESVDWLGALLLGIALTCLSLGLAQQGTDLGPSVTTGSTPQNNPLVLALALIFFALFIALGLLKRWRVPQFSLRSQPRLAFAQRQRWPIIDLALFKRLPFSAASLVSLFVGAALIIAMADIPLSIDTAYSLQISSSDVALVSGLALLRMTAMIPVGALLGGWLCGRFSCRLVGVLGLLFTAAGFYLMSRWSTQIDWTQITLSTMTAGLGFGLVIAPISTTAINAVRASQAGLGAAIVTALRMVGMILGLAALTSWGLAYFKQLASQFPSMPLNSNATQFAQWSRNYALHLTDAAHIVYGSVFFATMVLCLIAIVPAIFLWGTRPPLETTLPPEVEPVVVADSTDRDLHNAVTQTIPATGAITRVLEETPTFVPLPTRSGQTSRRRLIFALVGVGLALLLVAGGLTAFLLWQSSSPNNGSSSAGSAGPAATNTPVSGPRMINLALNNVALTSLFVSQLGLKDGTLSNIETTPVANDGLIVTLNLNINAGGLHRVLPVELDTTLGLDKQQNLQLTVVHVKRDGLDAGPAAATSMQSALNQLVLSAVMPALRGQLQGAKLVSVHTGSTIACDKGQEMLVLLIQAPPIQGIAAQPTPSALCFTKAVDLTKPLAG